MQSLTQVPASSAQSAEQAVQFKGLAPSHEAHELSHEAQVRFSPSNLLAGQADTQELSSKKDRVPLPSQLRHAVLPGPEHSRQLSWHGSHTVDPPSWLTYSESRHSPTQVEPRRKAASALLHERQSVLSGPEQVLHSPPHAMQWPLAFANLPKGVQDWRHAPTPTIQSPSRKGKAAAQAEQPSPLESTHVAQLSSHGSHWSVC
mmetsp:Transcript_3148/g.9473  ORF Transcript_3148/g.9473 Transcript_3148/m.9473 type:complete len:203 (+) Transcript_3148:1430-2038(+)